MADRTHRYEATCTWHGSTGAGYESYDRTHVGVGPPAVPEIRLTSTFHGDPSLLDPERLVVMAASSCQLLSFLAVAARARIDVRAYHDRAEGVMPEDDPPVRLTRIVLRPTIEVVAGPSQERVLHLVEVAHRECYIANSLRTEVEVEPEVRFLPPS